MNPTPYIDTSDHHNYAGYITAITLPSEDVFEIVDEHAREVIETLSGHTDFLGISSRELSDGATGALVPITAGGSTTTKTAVAGSIVVVNTTSTTAGLLSQEFIFDGTYWQLLGDISAENLGALAYKDNASGSITTLGSVSGTIGTITATGYYFPQITLLNTTTTFTLTTTSNATTAAGYLAYKPTGSIGVTLYNKNTTASVIETITGNTVLTGLTATGQHAEQAQLNEIACASVTTHNLLFSWLRPATGDTISYTTAAVVTNATASVTATSFSGDNIFFSPISVSIPSSTTASTATIYSTATAVKLVSSATTAQTITVS